MNKLNKKQKIIIIIIFIIIVTAIVYCIYANEKKELIPYDEELENINNNEMQIEEENKQLNEEKIVVHICGCVNKEGVIELNKNSRIADAIEMAGGLNNDADISQINLAYILEDGMKITIPNKNEKKENNNENSNVIVENNIKENNKKDNIIYKNDGGNRKMKHIFRKTLAVCLIGLGLGILLVLLLPLTGWLFIIGVTIVCVGFMWLAC